ncbi:WxL domain-containing protein [Enterococcus crotali]|uniref:WxL domain-containing protein n=1 Tax=Enterococcus crotali TaxID=1453587 RepID=UPI0004714CE0|nr:WxL domain-containing protein [Enterococcus crotali]
MKKRLFKQLVVTSAFASVVLCPKVGVADSIEAKQEIKTEVMDGNIAVKAKNINLSFDNIKYGNKETQYIYPTIDKESISQSDQQTVIETVNPYSGEQPVVPPEPWYPWKDVMMTITNNKTSAPDFKITLKRTGFTNKKSGKEMTGANFYMGKFHDSLDFKGEKRSKNAGEADKYWLAEYVTLEKDSSALIADYRGEAAIGEHWLSPFQVPETDEDGYRKNPYPGGYAHGEETYQEKNISLGIDANTKIPTAGSYVTTLTWSVEQTPG